MNTADTTKGGDMRTRSMSRGRMVVNGLVYAILGFATGAIVGFCRPDLQVSGVVLLTIYTLATPVLLLPIRRMAWQTPNHGEFTNWGVMSAYVLFNLVATIFLGTPGSVTIVMVPTVLAILFVIIGHSTDKRAAA